MQRGIASVMKILYTIMSFAFHRHKFLKIFRNVYSVGVILAIVLQGYVQYFSVADHLICVVPGICGAPGRYATPDEPPNDLGLGPIF